MSNAASLCLVVIEPVLQSPDTYKVSVPIPTGTVVSRTHKLLAILEFTNHLNQIPLQRMSISPNCDQVELVADQTYLPGIVKRVSELLESLQE